MFRTGGEMGVLGGGERAMDFLMLNLIISVFEFSSFMCAFVLCVCLYVWVFCKI